MKFDDIFDVRLTKYEYTFSLEGKQVSVSICCFTHTDKKIIDSLISGRCPQILRRKKDIKKIVDDRDSSQFEFTVTAKRTPVFYLFYIFFVVFGIIMVIVAVCNIAFGDADTGGVIAGTAFILMIALIFFIIEKEIPKDVISFRDNTFIFFHHAKVKHSFHRIEIQDIEKVGFSRLIFTIQNKDKRVNLPLNHFDLNSRRVLWENINIISIVG